MEVFDANGDGSLDIWFYNQGQNDHLFLNNGKGVFRDVSATNLVYVNAGYDAPTAHGDFDNDGDNDLWIAPNHVLENDGTGRFTLSKKIVISIAAPRAAQLYPCELNGDKLLDLVSGTGRVYLGAGNGAFTEISFTQLPSTTLRTGMLPVDVDLDGDLDLVARGTIFLGDGQGRFTDASSRARQLGMNGKLSRADFDGDGDVDLFDDGWKLLLNFHRQLEVPVAPALGSSFQLELHMRRGYAQKTQYAVPFLSFDVLAAPLTIPGLGQLQLDPKLLFASAGAAAARRRVGQLHCRSRYRTTGASRA